MSSHDLVAIQSRGSIELCGASWDGGTKQVQFSWHSFVIGSCACVWFILLVSLMCIYLIITNCNSGCSCVFDLQSGWQLPLQV